MAAKKKSSSVKAKKSRVPTTSQVTSRTRATTTKKAPARKVADKKTATKRTSAKQAAGNTAGNLTPEQRYRMIAEAAYYLAEKEQFRTDPVDAWIRAEQAVNARLNASA